MRLGRRERALASSSDDGVVVEDLSKIYHGLTQRAFEAPTPVLTRAFRGRRPSGIEEEVQEEDDDDEMIDEEPAEAEADYDAAVWALRELSFRIPRGAATALVGGSGSGKTTLLRVLAGATPPTSGRAVLAGPPSPLINVSVQLMTPSISPEANVAVAGALVGLGKRRLRAHFDKVLALAEVSAVERRHKVTRTPYKVAVASAVCLAGEVLLLDEPFASASEGFRELVAEAVERRHADGATVVIESSNREALRRICDQAIWLDQGSLVRMGPIDDVLAAYDASAAAASAAAPSPEATRGFNETAAIVAAEAEANAEGRVSVSLLLELSRAAVTLQAGVALERPDGFGIWVEQPEPVVCDLPGFHRFQVVLHEVPPGRYSGRVQARVLEAGNEAVIARRGLFEAGVGAPQEPGRPTSVTSWEQREASWLYEPDREPR